MDKTGMHAPETRRPEPVPTWRREMALAVTDPMELLAALDLPLPAPTSALASTLRNFPLRAPRPFVRRMQAGDPCDPLLRQVLPTVAETRAMTEFGPDPVGDMAALQTPGLLEKYGGRALLITTGACAVHCRYCFRRHFPYSESHISRDHWEDAKRRLRSNHSLREVILSGGDPLCLSDARLAELVAEIADCRHLGYLRIHTRVPIMIPARVDADLLAWLGESRLRTIMVIHVNHANEIDGEVAAALGRLSEHGVHLLNQSVLLSGVNDRVDSLAALSETLFSCGVMPYYLHLLDRVQGAAHFEVPEARAIALHRELKARLPGYLVPKLARETAGASAKLILG